MSNEVSSGKESTTKNLAEFLAVGGVVCFPSGKNAKDFTNTWGIGLTADAQDVISIPVAPPVVAKIMETQKVAAAGINQPNATFNAIKNGNLR